MRNKVKIACAAVLSGTMVMSMGMPGVTIKEQNIPKFMYSVKAAENVETAEDVQNAKNAQEAEEIDRSGNVYVEAEAHGTAKKVTVTEGLEGSAAAEELPVSVNVRYYLDGKEMDPEEMAGVSGHVTIRFEYENLTSELVEVDGKQRTVPVPFMVISAVILPTETFYNVEVSDGKIIAGEDQNIVAGLAFPGLEDSLKLQDYEPMEEVSIPDSFEVSADVTEFELELTATIVTPCGLNDMDLDDLDDVDELVDAIEELTDASKQLADGTGELADGMNAFQTYLSAYLEGVDQVNEGAKALADGLAVMDTSKESLEAGAAALQTGLENLQAALTQFSIPSGSDEGMQKAAEAAAVLKKDAESLAELLKTVRSQFEAAYSEMEGMNLDEMEKQIDAEATRQAQEQAKTEANEALQEILEGITIENEELSPEIKRQIIDEMKEQITGAMQEKSFEEVQVSGAAGGVKEQIEDTAEKLQNAAQEIDAEAVTAVLQDMQAQVEVLASYSEQIAGLGTQISVLNAAMGELQTGVGQLVDGSSQLSQGITAFDNGIGAASKGASALSSGVSELASAGSQLNSGFSLLTAGTSALQEGMVTFDKEGIQELSKLAGDDLTEVITRLKALKEAEKNYNQKAGLEERGIDGIKFIIETEEISD